MDNCNIRDLASKQLSMDFSDVEIIESDSVLVEVKEGKKIVGGANVPQKLRAFSLLALNDNDITIKQYPKFKYLGAMIDMSRNGVMRVEKVKEYINKLVMFGANEILLYTEDIYTLEDYPHFGYCRGRYTDEELIEIDDYAYSLDVEVVPCIQTLGHMARYLSWGGETGKFKDTPSVLLCDNEDTFVFIEAEIAKMRKVFRSKQIHIGMDEAHDVGLGQYLRKNGYVDRYELLKRHLGKVVDICKKYDFTPMMWSDMFFRLSLPTDEYYIYDWDFHFEEKIINNVPDVQMVYWDYYNGDVGCYRNMMRLHRELGKPIVFAGGIWTWSGFLPDYIKTKNTMIPALRVCREEKLDNVFTTMWGDDGCETDPFRAIYSFGYFSEYCYCEEEPTIEQIEKIGALISGNEKEYINEVAKFQEYYGGKGLIWGNIFYNLTGKDYNETEHIKHYESALDSNKLKNDEFAELVFKISLLKGKIYAGMQKAYKENANLTVYEKEILPQLLENYERLYELHRKNWYETFKPFGFEELEKRYAAMIFGIKSAIKTLHEYSSGKIEKIEELEYEPIYGEERGPYFAVCFSA